MNGRADEITRPGFGRGSERPGRRAVTDVDGYAPPQKPSPEPDSSPRADRHTLTARAEKTTPVKLPAIIALAAAVAAPVIVAGCGSSEPTTRSAAGSSPGQLLPTTAFLTTGFGGAIKDRKGAPTLTRCSLPEGPCTRVVANLGRDGLVPDSAQYMNGRVILSLTNPGRSTGREIVSCSATSPNDCRVVIPYNSNLAFGPVRGADGRIMVSTTLAGRNDGVYSCDPETTRALSDCRRPPGMPGFWSFAPAGPDRIIGLADVPEETIQQVVLDCSVDDGRCTTVGSGGPLWGPFDLYYADRFARAYSTVGTKVWSCDVAGSMGCSVLDTLSAKGTALSSDADAIYVGTEKGVQACDPLRSNACRRVSGDTYVSALQPYGDNLLVATYREYDDWTNQARTDGGLYLRSLGSGAGRTVWGGDGFRTSGVTSFATDFSDVGVHLEMTVVRYSPRGSRGTAMGGLAVAPGPTEGSAECALTTKELPVTCRSVFRTGTRITIRATPEPGSVLNTWTGAAQVCNEPNGPGSAPSPTCTLTLARDTYLGAGFRPAG